MLQYVKNRQVVPYRITKSTFLCVIIFPGTTFNTNENNINILEVPLFNIQRDIVLSIQPIELKSEIDSHRYWQQHEIL